MKPTVGRIVHYVSYGTPGGEYASECRAAVVTEVPLTLERPDDAPAGLISEAVDLASRGRIGLAVLNPSGMFFNEADYDEGDTSDTSGAPTARSYRGGSWHWPEREDT
jgi:hypothetical protein